MRTQQAQVTTVDRDIIILSLFGEVEKPNISKFSGQNVETWSGFGITAGTIVESISSALNESKTSDIPEPITQDTSASIKVSYDEEIESGGTQEFADSQVQHFNFLSYTEEDLLYWDAAIITPPPRPSGTIRVKLKYKGRSKPFPADSFWEE